VLGKLDIAARYMPGTGREERKTITAVMGREDRRRKSKWEGQKENQKKKVARVRTGT
jgi:hypothetical protein